MVSNTCNTIGELREALSQFPDDAPIAYMCSVTYYYEEGKPRIIIE